MASTGSILSLINFLVLTSVTKSTAIQEQVTVEQGVLEGVHSTTDNGFGYYAFLGIPYASPPIGNSRFRDPDPVQNWEGVYEATRYGHECPRLDVDSFTGDEDCLFLNVFVPNTTDTNSNLPVMFWIHGGGYDWGDGGASFYGPEHIIEKNVIFITINYRLGALGFLSVFSEENSGNMGLKDTLLALKWVNNNIESFGGDSGNITILGESAGGMSVELIILSPSSQGLFKRAIDQSGPSLFEDLLRLDGPERFAYYLGSKLGYNTENADELISFLRTISAENIARAALAITEELDEGIIFAPVVEKLTSPNAFLTEHSRDILMSGNYNPIDEIMYGTTSQEGILDYEKFIHMDVDWNNVSVDIIIPDFKKFIPYEINNLLDDEKREVAASLIRNFYFPNGDENALENFIDLRSDFYFNRLIQFSFNNISKKAGSAYYYKFSYNGVLNYIQHFVPFSYSEAAHSDEQGYLFTGIYNAYGDPTERDNLMVRRMVDMWTNFAKYGNPTPEITDVLNVEWKPVNESHFYYLDIDDNITLRLNPFQERMKFWDDLAEFAKDGSNDIKSCFYITILMFLVLKRFE